MTTLIPCGFPAPAADEEGSAPLSLDALVGSARPSVFFMRMEGNGGEAWGIYSGDLLVVDRAAPLRRGALGIREEAEGLVLCRVAPPARGTAISPARWWGRVTHVVRAL